MEKNRKVNKIGIVSLSSGVLGEEFVKHEIEIGLKRLKEYGIEVEFMKNSRKGIDYLKSNPQKRAEDLIEAFSDDSIDMVMCAIGGDDTYRTLQYILEDENYKRLKKNKIFLGFSDTTINHFMFNKIGIKTFYGQAFLTDICELSDEMLPYSKMFFEELIETGSIKEIRPSEFWYDERTDYSVNGVGIEMNKHENTGFELIRGKSKFKGKILGGCLETIYDMFDNTRHEDSAEVCHKYEIFPNKEEWKDNILLIETSEEKTEPEKYREMIRVLKNEGIFDVLSGVVVGKPQDNVYYDEYKQILLEEIDNQGLSIVLNINVGHCTPRCIIPFGVETEVDTEENLIRFFM